MAAEHENVIDDAFLTAEQQTLNAKLFFILTGIMEGPAFEKLQTVKGGNGLEVWRILAQKNRPKTVGHKRAKLKKIINPTFPEDKTTYEQRKDWWYSEIKDYESRGSDKVSDSIKMAVIGGVLAPPELRAHLVMNASRLDTVDKVESEIEQCMDAMEGNAEAAGDPMDTNAMSKDPKGKGKGKGKGKVKGKTKGKGAKGTKGGAGAGKGQGGQGYAGSGSSPATSSFDG